MFNWFFPSFIHTAVKNLTAPFIKITSDLNNGILKIAKGKEQDGSKNKQKRSYGKESPRQKAIQHAITDKYLHKFKSIENKTIFNFEDMFVLLSYAIGTEDAIRCINGESVGGFDTSILRASNDVIAKLTDKFNNTAVNAKSINFQVVLNTDLIDTATLLQQQIYNYLYVCATSSPIDLKKQIEGKQTDSEKTDNSKSVNALSTDVIHSPSDLLEQYAAYKKSNKTAGSVISDLFAGADKLAHIRKSRDFGLSLLRYARNSAKFLKDNDIASAYGSDIRYNQKHTRTDISEEELASRIEAVNTLLERAICDGMLAFYSNPGNQLILVSNAIKYLQKSTKEEISTDALVGESEDGEGVTLGDTLADPESDITELLFNDIDKSDIRSINKRADERYNDLKEIYRVVLNQNFPGTKNENTRYRMLEYFDTVIGNKVDDIKRINKYVVDTDSFNQVFGSDMGEINVKDIYNDCKKKYALTKQIKNPFSTLANIQTAGGNTMALADVDVSVKFLKQLKAIITDHESWRQASHIGNVGGAPITPSATNIELLSKELIEQTNNVLSANKEEQETKLADINTIISYILNAAQEAGIALIGSLPDLSTLEKINDSSVTKIHNFTQDNLYQLTTLGGTAEWKKSVSPMDALLDVENKVSSISMVRSLSDLGGKQKSIEYLSKFSSAAQKIVEGKDIKALESILNKAITGGRNALSSWLYNNQDANDSIAEAVYQKIDDTMKNKYNLLEGNIANAHPDSSDAEKKQYYNAAKVVLDTTKETAFRDAAEFLYSRSTLRKGYESVYKVKTAIFTQHIDNCSLLLKKLNDLGTQLTNYQTSGEKDIFKDQLRNNLKAILMTLPDPENTLETYVNNFIQNPISYMPDIKRRLYGLSASTYDKDLSKTNGFLLALKQWCNDALSKMPGKYDDTIAELNKLSDKYNVSRYRSAPGQIDANIKKFSAFCDSVYKYHVLSEKTDGFKEYFINQYVKLPKLRKDLAKLEADDLEGTERYAKKQREIEELEASGIDFETKNAGEAYIEGMRTHTVSESDVIQVACLSQNEAFRGKDYAIYVERSSAYYPVSKETINDKVVYGVSTIPFPEPTISDPAINISSNDKCRYVIDQKTKKAYRYYTIGGVVELVNTPVNSDKDVIFESASKPISLDQLLSGKLPTESEDNTKSEEESEDRNEILTDIFTHAKDITSFYDRVTKLLNLLAVCRNSKTEDTAKLAKEVEASITDSISDMVDENKNDIRELSKIYYFLEEKNARKLIKSDKMDELMKTLYDTLYAEKDIEVPLDTRIQIWADILVNNSDSLSDDLVKKCANKLVSKITSVIKIAESEIVETPESDDADDNLAEKKVIAEKVLELLQYAINAAKVADVRLGGGKYAGMFEFLEKRFKEKTKYILKEEETDDSNTQPAATDEDTDVDELSEPEDQNTAKKYKKAAVTHRIEKNAAFFHFAVKQKPFFIVNASEFNPTTTELNKEIETPMLGGVQPENKLTTDTEKSGQKPAELDEKESSEFSTKNVVKALKMAYGKDEAFFNELLNVISDSSPNMGEITANVLKQLPSSGWTFEAALRKYNLQNPDKQKHRRSVQLCLEEHGWPQLIKNNKFVQLLNNYNSGESK